MDNTTTTIERAPEVSPFSIKGYAFAKQIATELSAASLIPEPFKGNVANTMIAIEFATRIGASPLMVMQNLNVIKGKPSWSSSFIIAALNASKRFSPLRFETTGAGPSLSCYAWAYANNSDEKLIGPAVTMAMAQAEEWVSRAGSKWKTMPELMIRYRAAAFFGRLYAPEILMGMHSSEEVLEIQAQEVETVAPNAPVASEGVAEAPAIDARLESLQALYLDKLEFLDKKEMIAAKRVIDNREVASYEKLFKFLTDKTGAQ